MQVDGNMKATEFCYWLQGMFELSGNSLQTINAEQLEIIKKHLNMVFIHDIDPSYPASQQQQLNETHNGGHSNIHTTKLRC